MEWDGIDHEGLAARYGIVGSVLGLSVGGRRSVSVQGVADVRTGQLVERSTAFLAGSVTKAMTATIVAMLVAEETVDLDAPVQRYLPAFAVADPEASARITVRHLLTHTSGFDGDVWPDHGEGDEALERFVASMVVLQQLTPPGARFSYNNAAYSVLGRLIERVTGATFESALREHVATPCGCGLTTDLRRADTGPHAVGHVTGDDGPVALEVVVGPACLAPAGSRTWATADDLLAFGELHLGRHGFPATHEALLAMRDPQVQVVDPNNGGTMCLGVFVDDRWGAPVVFHDGGVAGQAAYLRIVPELDAVLVLMSTGGVPQTFHRHVFRSVSARLGLDAPLAAVADPTLHVERDRYVGHYASSSMDVVVEPDDDGLSATVTWGPGSPSSVTRTGLRLAAVDERVFLTPLDGRDYVFVFPPADEPCDHVLAALRLLRRQ